MWVLIDTATNEKTIFESESEALIEKKMRELNLFCAHISELRNRTLPRNFLHSKKDEFIKRTARFALVQSDSVVKKPMKRVIQKGTKNE